MTTREKSHQYKTRRMHHEHSSKYIELTFTMFPLLVFHLWYALYIEQDWRLEADFTPERLVKDPISPKPL